MLGTTDGLLDNMFTAQMEAVDRPQRSEKEIYRSEKPARKIAKKAYSNSERRALRYAFRKGFLVGRGIAGRRRD